MTARIEFYRDKSGLHRWRLIARNKRILADSGEGYATEASAERGCLASLKCLHTAAVDFERQRDGGKLTPASGKRSSKKCGNRIPQK
jgi:uncharacterized protein YegP (UPF0339 family)